MHFNNYEKGLYVILASIIQSNPKLNHQEAAKLAISYMRSLNDEFDKELKEMRKEDFKR